MAETKDITINDCVVEIEIAASTIKKKLEKHHKKYCSKHHNRNSYTSNDNLSDKITNINCITTTTNNSNNNNEYSQLLDEECTCGEARLNIEEGKTSTVIISPIMNRKAHRREGVSEKNNTERKLVKEAVKLVARSANMVDLNMI